MMQKIKLFGLRAFQIIGSIIFFLNALAGVSNGLTGKTSAEDFGIPLGVGIGGFFIIFLSQPKIQQKISERHILWKEKISPSLPQVIGLYMVVWLTLTCAFSAFVYFAMFKSEMLPLRQMAAEGIQTLGRVEAKGAEAPFLISYSYIVKGKVYKNVSGKSYGITSFEKIKVNDKIPVFYLPSNPKKSMLENPKIGLDSQIWGMRIMPIFFSIFILVQLMRSNLLPKYKRP